MEGIITTGIITGKADTTAITTPTANTEADTYRMTMVDPATSITEHLQAGTHQNHIGTPSELGNKTCKFGYI